jgi:hypothetical protein
MTDDTPLPFDLSAVRRKKLTIDFDGGNQSSNGGLLLLRHAERKLGVCRRIADAMVDRRDPSRIRHAVFEMVMARVSAIACGHKDAIDLDRLRHDPLMKVAVGRCPESGAPLASQSTISRLENAPSRTEAARLTAALVDQAGTTVRPCNQEILDIDDTFCAAHGGQQLAFWNAHHDERGFASMHIYHVASGTPVVTILRPARTPKGTEVRTVLRHEQYGQSSERSAVLEQLENTRRRDVPAMTVTPVPEPNPPGPNQTADLTPAAATCTASRRPPTRTETAVPGMVPVQGSRAGGLQLVARMAGRLRPTRYLGAPAGCSWSRLIGQLRAGKAFCGQRPCRWRRGFGLGFGRRGIGWRRGRGRPHVLSLFDFPAKNPQTSAPTQKPGRSSRP